MKTIKSEQRSVGDIIFRIIFNILMAVILFVFLVSAAVFLVLAFKPLYYWFIDLFKIEAYSGYTKDILKANYDALIDFNMFWGPKELVFPDHGMVTTEQTMAHFVDVKQIFVLFQYLAIGSAALLIPGCVVAKVKKITIWPKITLALAVAVIVSVGIGLLFFWDTFFIRFHEVVFPGKTNWYINANYDKVILILPSEVFLGDAAAILALIALGILLFVIFFRKGKDPEAKEQKKQERRAKREAKKAEQEARKEQEAAEKEALKQAEETAEEKPEEAAEEKAEEPAENAPSEEKQEEQPVEEALAVVLTAEDEAAEKAEETIEETREAAEEAVEKAEEALEEAEETIVLTADAAKETIEESRAAAEEGVRKAAETVSASTAERFEEMDEEAAKTVEAFAEAFEELDF